jgi:hypothetical protein
LLVELDELLLELDELLCRTVGDDLERVDDDGLELVEVRRRLALERLRFALELVDR